MYSPRFPHYTGGKLPDFLGRFPLSLVNIFVDWSPCLICLSCFLYSNIFFPANHRPHRLHDLLLDGHRILRHGRLGALRIHPALLGEFLQGFDAIPVQLQLRQDHGGGDAARARHKDLEGEMRSAMEKQLIC